MWGVMGVPSALGETEGSMDALAQAALLDGILSIQYVSEYTHNFYRYPARFSPWLVRNIIAAFTEPGDLVLDPFMGGGTTLVEALAAGRRSAGVDINPLAVFLARTKTTILHASELSNLETWAAELSGRLNLGSHALVSRDAQWAAYQRNIGSPDTWRVRKLLALALDTIEALPTERQRAFARCVLLRTGQWALDSRAKIPTAAEFRNELERNAFSMAAGVRGLADAVARSTEEHAIPPQAVLTIEGSTVGIQQLEAVSGLPSPRLILTSPPYPGVHVLYHRWQVLGRRETPAPYWIAGCEDGHYASFYTFGDRQRGGLAPYFETLGTSFASLAALSSSDTMLIQLVAFSDPSWQLPRYLATLETSGFAEVRLPSLANGDDGRVWRDVPHRKWYADQRGATPASTEVVLFHRLQ
jgi:hypothetical protein